MPKRLILWFVALALLVLVPWIVWGGNWEEKFTLPGSVGWLEQAGPWAWAAGILLLLGDLVLPVPGTVVMSALGFIYGPVAGGLLATAGSMLAGIAGYGIGRLLGEKRARRWLGAEGFDQGRALFARGGGWMVALSRALPILPEAMSCTAGLLQMPFSRFVIALACGSLPISFIFSVIGAAGHDSPGLAFAASLILPALLWLAARRLENS